MGEVFFMVAVLPVVGHARNFSLYFSATGLGAETELKDIFGKFENVVGKTTLDELVKVTGKVLENEVSSILKSHNLNEDFPIYVQLFWASMLPLLTKFSTSMMLSKVEDFKELGISLAEEITRRLRSTQSIYAEDLVYSLSVLIDHDLWVFDKVAVYGLEGLFDRLTKRAEREVTEASGYLAYLVFAWFSASSAILGLVRDYREENLGILVSWSKHYAREVDAYIDTLDLLVDDETYNELRETGVAK